MRMNEQPKLRGFAAMTPERRREVARMGGKSIPPEKRWYARNREAASKAGKVGGKALPKLNRNDEAFLRDVIQDDGIPWYQAEGMNRAGRNRIARLLELGALVYDEARDWVRPAPKAS